MDRILILASDNGNEMMKRQVVNLKRIYPEAKIHRFEEGGHHIAFCFFDEYNEVVKRFL